MSKPRGNLVVISSQHESSKEHNAFCQASGEQALEEFNSMLVLSEVFPEGCAACGAMSMISTFMANLFSVMHEEDHDVIEQALVGLVKRSREAERRHHKKNEEESEAEKRLKKIYKEIKS